MNEGLCPECGQVGRWLFKGISVSYPPTGGDYQWAETHATTHCPHCEAMIEARIRVDLDDLSSYHLIWSPMPVKEAWHCYVLAKVYHFGEQNAQVTVYQFADDPSMLEPALQALRNEHYEVWYDQRAILKLSAAGYEALDGQPLHESVNNAIYYA